MKDFFHRITTKIKTNKGNLVIFLLALLLASTIWLIHNLTLKYTHVLSVQLILDSNLEGRMSTSVTSTEVTAVCRATGFQLISFGLSNGKRGVNLRVLPDDLVFQESDLYYITSEQLKNYSKDIFGAGVFVDHFLTDKYYFRFNKQNSKKLPIVPVYRLSFKPQYMSEEGLKIQPDSVNVYGEESYLEKLEEIITELIPLDELHTSKSGRAKLEKQKGLRYSVDNIKWSIEVNRFVELEKIVNINVKNLPAGKSIQVYPSSIKAKIRYLFPIISSAKEADIFYVDYNDFSESISGKCIIKAEELPDGILGYELSQDIVDCMQK